MAEDGEDWIGLQMTNKDDIFQNAKTISLHILDHTILLTCVSFSKKLPYLCFFSFIYELAACR